MQCDCHTTLESKLREKVKSQIPEGARNFSGSLEGYAFILEGNAMVTRPAMPFKVEYEAPKKRGDGFTKKKETVSITANYCPFCGKAAKAEEEPELKEEQEAS